MEKQLSLNLLLLDDNEEDIEALTECIEENSIQNLKVFIAKSAEEAIEYLDDYLYHIVSLDQRIPMNLNGILSDENLTPVLEKYNISQPISDGIVFTGYRNLLPGIKATKSKLEYIEKGVYSEKEWIEILLKLIKTTLKRSLKKDKLESLPFLFIKFINTIKYESEPWLKITAWKDLYEVVLKLYTMVFAAICQNESQLKAFSKKIIINLYNSRMYNNDWQTALQKLFSLVIDKNHFFNQRYVHEINKYLVNGSGNFINTINSLRVFRNEEFAHTMLKNKDSYKKVFNSMNFHFLSLIESCYMFSQNPLLDYIEPKISPNEYNEYFAKDFRGSQLNPRKIPFTSSIKFSSSEMHWCINGFNNIIEETIPLSPFIFSRFDEDDVVRIYYLKDFNHFLYKDFLSNKEIHVPFTDSYISSYIK